MPDPSVIPEVNPTGFWGAVTAAIVLAGKLLWDKRPRKKTVEHPATSLHNVLLEVQASQKEMQILQREQEKQLIRMEVGQVTKDYLIDKLDEVGDRVSAKVGEVHVRLDNHIKDSHTKAA